MFKSGKFVARHLKPHDGGELDDEQIQPNGVDLTIDEILQHSGSAYMSDEEYQKPARSRASMIKADGMPDRVEQYVDSDWVYNLDPGGYIVVYDEKVIEIPKDHVGLVVPRSRFLRTSAHLTTALWDTGYSGRGEGALITTQPMWIDPDMRIGQMTFIRADSMGTYDGSHQGERVE